MSNESLPNPELDGVDHINIWTRAKTPLGRMLSNLFPLHLNHPKYGRFDTAEGLWYYLSTGKIYEQLRDLNGFEAKTLGRTLKKFHYEGFQADFKLGMLAKVKEHEDLQEMLMESTLPLVHYYWYGKEPKNAKVVVPKDQDWMMEYWEEIRTLLKNDRISYD